MKENEPAVDLCLEVLARLAKAGVLEELIVIGSWCVHFYGEYLGEGARVSALRTRDIDLMVPASAKIKNPVRVATLLEDLGFVPDLHEQGCVRLDHPRLIIDFLTVERRMNHGRPHAITALGIYAQPLRFLSLLSDRTIVARYHGLNIRLPHPINFALHKLLISGRRGKSGKRMKDRRQAIEVLGAVLERGEAAAIRSTLFALPTRWQKAILRSLLEEDAFGLASLLKA